MLVHFYVQIFTSVLLPIIIIILIIIIIIVIIKIIKIMLINYVLFSPSVRVEPEQDDIGRQTRHLVRG